MILSTRQLQILEAIITDYIQTAEPIGSRTIAKKAGLGISSATIRNEMSDLEELGLISQPHTSAGRVTSGRGYRLYVDTMMPQRSLDAEIALFLQKMIIDNIHQVEFMMQETAKALSWLTGCPAIVSEPYLKKTKIRHVQLVPMDEKSLLLVLVTDTKAVKTQTVNVKAPPSYENLNRLSAVLSANLSGLGIHEIDRERINKLLGLFEKSAHTLMPILGAISDIIQAEDDVRIFTSGVKNILNFPEFADIRRAEVLFHALEDRDTLQKILESDPTEKGVQILIGDENNVEILKSCGLIRASYTLDNSNRGSIAIIGPMRMDYGRAVSVMVGVLQNMQRVKHALEM